MSTIQIIPPASENIVLEFNCKQVGKAYMLFQLVQHVQKHGEGLHAPESSMMLTRRMTMQEICKKIWECNFRLLQSLQCRVHWRKFCSALASMQCSIMQYIALHLQCTEYHLLIALDWRAQAQCTTVHCIRVYCTVWTVQWVEAACRRSEFPLNWELKSQAHVCS